MQKKYVAIGLIIVEMLISTSCYQEFTIVPNHTNNIFSLTMSANAEKKIMDSRGEQFSIEPLPVLTYGGTQYLLGQMKIRGQSALDFQRKSYSINLDNSISFLIEDNSLRKFEKFKLIAMVFDYTYIENRLSHRLLNEIELWPLYSFFTELKINDHHQGLYLFIEDPSTFAFKIKNADFILRRYYRNEIASFELNQSVALYKSQEYIEKFRSIYTDELKNYKGEQLYSRLSSRMNIDNYMRKMAFDFIIENGDYTDEVYFYSTTKNNEVYFDIIPWDYDDLFSGSRHEVGRDWAVGTIFGERVYSSDEDVLTKLNGRLIFSIEDDLDYAIAFDDYLYQKYLIELKYVLLKITSTKLDLTFDELHTELWPFYQKPEIIAQSQYDANPTSLEIFDENIQNKKTELINRINWINKQLENE